MTAELTVTVAPRFMEDYLRAGVGLQGLAEGAIKDLLRRAESDPRGWRRLYDRVAGLARRVLEIDLAGGPRLLALDDGELVLWRMGDHSLIKEVTRSKPSYPDSTLPLPGQFRPHEPSRLFPPDADAGYIDYANERSADWAYWLDTEQAEVASRVLDQIEDSFLNGERVVVGLLGGPGTGKTTILVWLLKQLATLESGASALDVEIAAPRSVLNQIENSMNWDLRPFTFDQHEPPAQADSGDSSSPPDAVLVDDPQSLEVIEQILEAFPKTSVVFGFDPLQMSQVMMDAEFDDWLAAVGAEATWFKACYRQKEVVGKAAKHVADVVASSSPFLREDKKKRHTDEGRELTRRANDLTFVNPSGAVRTILEPSWDDWAEYCDYLYNLRRQGRLWNHWPPLLVITDPAAEIDPRWLSRIDPVASHRRSIDDLPSVKGLEYQHVLMLLGRHLYGSINEGFEGSGQAAYNRYRLFRIPFSRAKDSLTTFVFPSRD